MPEEYYTTYSDEITCEAFLAVILDELSWPFKTMWSSTSHSKAQ